MKKLILWGLCAFLAGCSFLKSFREDDGILRVAVASLPPNYDPVNSELTPAWDHLRLVFESLLQWKWNGERGALELSPVALKTLPDSADGGRTWRLNLRDGISFSDGSAATAEDLQASFQRAALFSGDGVLKTNLDSIASVRAVSETEVLISLKTANPAWIEALTHPHLMLVPKAFADKRMESGLRGTGPYELTRSSPASLTFRHRQSGQVLELQRNLNADLKIVDQKRSFDLIEIPEEAMLSRELIEVLQAPEKHQWTLAASPETFLSALLLSRPLPAAEANALFSAVQSADLISLILPYQGSKSARFFPAWTKSAEAEATPSAVTAASGKSYRILLPKHGEGERFFSALKGALEAKSIGLEPVYAEMNEMASQLPKTDLSSAYLKFSWIRPLEYLEQLAVWASWSAEQRRRLLPASASGITTEALNAISQELSRSKRILPLGFFRRTYLARSWVSGLEVHQGTLDLSKASLNVDQRKKR